MKWLEYDAAHCWHPFTRHGVGVEPLPVVRAEGAYLHLADGRRLLDAIASWWCCLHGHGSARLVRAMAEQAACLDHVLFAGCTHEPAAELARELVEIAPEGLNRVFFSDNGSTAVEVALKMAVQAWRRRGEARRTVFVVLEGGYHGDTFGAMSVGDPDPFFTAFAPLLFSVRRVPVHEKALETLDGESDRIAAVVVEPAIQGAGGMRWVSTEFLQAVRRFCDETGVFLIADEVFSGFGRTGAWFGCDHAGVKPDLLCVSKALSNGMFPLAATLVREAIFADFLGSDPDAMLFHGHTMTANPIGCRVALESLRMAREVDAPARYRAQGRSIHAAAEVASSAGMELRQLGGVVALELVDEEGGYLSGMGDLLKERSRLRDVLIRPLGPVLYALPPICLTDEECVHVGRTMAEVAREALEARKSR